MTELRSKGALRIGWTGICQSVEDQPLCKRVVVDILVGDEQAAVVVLERKVLGTLLTPQKTTSVRDYDLVVISGDLGERALARRVVAAIEPGDEI